MDETRYVLQVFAEGEWKPYRGIWFVNDDQQALNQAKVVVNEIRAFNQDTREFRLIHVISDIL